MKGAVQQALIKGFFAETSLLCPETQGWLTKRWSWQLGDPSTFKTFWTGLFKMFLGQTPKEGPRNFGRTPQTLSTVLGWMVFRVNPQDCLRGFGMNTPIFWNVLEWTLQFFETVFGVIPQDFIGWVVEWTPQFYFYFWEWAPNTFRIFWVNQSTKTNQANEIWWNLMKLDEIWWNLMKTWFSSNFIKFHQISSNFTGPFFFEK